MGSRPLLLRWEKMFCVTGLEQTPVGVSFKVTDEEFEEVSARRGFRPADYVARYKWVTVEDVRKISKKDLEKFIKAREKEASKGDKKRLDKTISSMASQKKKATRATSSRGSSEN